MAEHNGSTFSVVLLPRRPPQPFTVDLLYAEGVEVIDLYNCFGTHDPAHNDLDWYYSSYRFRKDGHWNEAGNRLAAVCLYRVLEEKTGLPRLSEGRLQETLSRYYAAFEKETILKARGGIEGAGSLKTSADIREKYTAFDMNTPLKKFKEEILESATQPNKRIIASDFDVFLVQNRLIYIKEHCSPADMKARFFLHVIPVDRRDLYEDHRKRGFQIMRPSFWRVFRVGRHGCAARIKLPLYPVRYMQTGQYVRSEGRRLWEGAAWIDPHSVGEERPEFPAAAGKRIIRSDFDVYLDDRQLVYHKTVCDPADREPSFFLHVVPTDETVLPPDRVQYEFENLNFNSCTIERNLPAYTIRHIRTGQYTDEGQLWGVEFPLEQTSGSRGDERAAALQRTVRSVFDVTLDGRRLIYRKAACRPADREAPFFLHVTPVDATDLLPTRVQWGFESLDFWHRSEFRVDEFGCTIKRRLPGYAIRGIRTGQYIPGKGPLWEGEFAMMQDTLGQD